jgi:hypothetical protein
MAVAYTNVPRCDITCTRQDCWVGNLQSVNHGNERLPVFHLLRMGGSDVGNAACSWEGNCSVGHINCERITYSSAAMGTSMRLMHAGRVEPEAIT